VAAEQEREKGKLLKPKKWPNLYGRCMDVNGIFDDQWIVHIVQGKLIL
jgi:hypothetical protein